MPSGVCLHQLVEQVHRHVAVDLQVLDRLLPRLQRFDLGRRLAMSLICTSSLRDLGLQERVALLLAGGQLLHARGTRRRRRRAPTTAATPSPAKNATFRRLRRSSRCGSRLIRITARTSASPGRTP